MGVLFETLTFVTLGVLVQFGVAVWHWIRQEPRVLTFGALEAPLDWTMLAQVWVMTSVVSLVLLYVGQPMTLVAMVLTVPVSGVYGLVVTVGLYAADRVLLLLEPIVTAEQVTRTFQRRPRTPIVGDSDDETRPHHAAACMLIAHPDHPEACCTCTQPRARVRQRGMPIEPNAAREYLASRTRRTRKRTSDAG